MASKSQLLSKLPTLPADPGLTLNSSVVSGLRAALGTRGGSDPLEIIDTVRNTDRGVFGSAYIDVLDSGHDVMNDGNMVRRRMKHFQSPGDPFLGTLNNALAGGSGHPLVVLLGTVAIGVSMGPVGMGLGAIALGSSITWASFNTAINMSRTNQPVRARNGDAVDLQEILAKRGDDVVHIEQIYLVDLLRARAGVAPFEYLIHHNESVVTIN